MANRTRTQRLVIDVTPEEHDLIKQKMEQIGTDNFSAYARKVLIDGYVVKQDHKAFKELTTELSRIGNNINQIARKANASSYVNKEEISVLQTQVSEIWQLLKSTLSSQL